MNETGIDAQIKRVRGKPHRTENLFILVIPGTRAVAKTVEGFLEEPIFVGFCRGVTKRRANNCDFFGREKYITECILHIAFLEGATAFNGKAD